MSASLTVRHATATHQGLVRANNEDSAYAGTRLFVLADGVGGEVAGEVASRLVVEALAPLDEAPPAGDPLDALAAAVDTATDRINAATGADPSLAGMASTLTAILVTGADLALVHVGDSRAYRLRGGELRQLTRDDTYVQHLVEAGRIGSDEAFGHPQRSIVTQVVQGSPVRPSLTRLRPRPGDRYLLCSDGLSDYVPAGDIADLLRTEEDPDACAARLIEATLVAGAPDNVTVVVLDTAEGPARPAHPMLALLLGLLVVAGLAGATTWYLSR
jgi:serine/threonine protein phosphatase PrpC